jgi:hypothetical protein
MVFNGLRRKVTDEITRLSEELRREQVEWEYNERLKNERMDKWWDAILSEEEDYARKKMTKEAIDKEKRVEAHRALSDGTRKLPFHCFL